MADDPLTVSSRAPTVWLSRRPDRRLAQARHRTDADLRLLAQLLSDHGSISATPQTVLLLVNRPHPQLWKLRVAFGGELGPLHYALRWKLRLPQLEAAALLDALAPLLCARLAVAARAIAHCCRDPAAWDVIDPSTQESLEEARVCPPSLCDRYEPPGPPADLRCLGRG